MDHARRTKAFGVFQGGGVKGVAYVGALTRTFEVFDFVRVAGTSAGAIIASLYAAGYSPEELNEILQSPEFPKVLLDGGWTNMRKGFLHTGEKFYSWISELLHKKCGKGMGAQVTFKDMERPLKVVAADITHRRPIIFPDDAGENFEVALAVRMSMSIPYFFKPVEWGRSLVVDGSVISNFPVWIFKKEREAGIQLPIIGFRLESTPKEPHPPEGQFETFAAIFETMMGALDTVSSEQLESDLYTVTVPTGDIKTTDFNLTPEQKKQLFDWGVEAADKFILSWQTGRTVQGAQFYRRFFETTTELAHTVYASYRTDHRLAEMKDTYTINEDYSATIVREYTVAAETQPVYAMQVVIGAASTARFDELGMELTPANPQAKVFLLPYQDSPNEKRVLVTFVPAILPGETRSFTYRCTWPGAWQPLKDTGQDILSAFPYDYGTTDQYSLRLVYDSDIQRIQVQPMVNRGNFNPEPQVLDDEHFYYEWTDSNVTMGTEYTLKVSEV